eukprot:4583648-Prorocentrum_lima.AAC.1
MKYILILVDNCSRWVELIALPNQKAVTIARKIISHLFCHWGVPIRLQSDRGSNLLDPIIHSICQLVGMKRVVSSAFSLETEGKVKRINLD